MCREEDDETQHYGMVEGSKNKHTTKYDSFHSKLRLHLGYITFVIEWALFGYFLLLFATLNSTWICEVENFVHPQMYTKKPRPMP